MLEPVSTLEDRVREIASDLKLELSGLAKTAKVNRATLYAAFNRERQRGYHNIDTDTAAALARVSSKSVEWILTGRSGSEKRDIPAAVSRRLQLLARRLGVDPALTLAHWVDIEGGSPSNGHDSADAVRDLKNIRDRKQLATLSRRLVMAEESITILAQHDSREGLQMDGLPEHIRRAAHAAAHLENRSIEDALVAAERARIDLGDDYAKDADGWVHQIRVRLNSSSGIRPSSSGKLTAVPKQDEPKGKRPRS